MYSKKNVLVAALTVVVISSCAGLSGTSKGKSVEGDDSVKLKAYIAKGPNFGLSGCFEDGSFDDYDIKIVTESSEFSKKKIKVKTSGKKGAYETTATFLVRVIYTIVVLDRSGKELVRDVRPGSATKAGYGFGLNRSDSEARATQRAIGNALGKVVEDLTPIISGEICRHPALLTYEALPETERGGLLGREIAGKADARVIILDQSDNAGKNIEGGKHFSKFVKALERFAEKRFSEVVVRSEIGTLEPCDLVVWPMNISVDRSIDGYSRGGGRVDVKAEVRLKTHDFAKAYEIVGHGEYFDNILIVIPQQVLGIGTLFTYTRFLQEPRYEATAIKRAMKPIAADVFNEGLSHPYFDRFCSK